MILLDWTPWAAPALADALSRKYRVLIVEPPADTGQTGTAQQTAAAVAGIAEAAGLESYSLVGVSLGADVALRLALLRPGSVNTLALVSPLCVGPAAPRPWNTPDLAIRTLLAHPDAGDHEPPDSARTAALSELAGRWLAEEGDAAALLPRVACATLAVFGQEDRLVSRNAGGVWKERVPNCSVSYVYDAGHAIALDRPEALVNVVLDFLERRETFIVENRSSIISP